jgi:hypothetical protein
MGMFAVSHIVCWKYVTPFFIFIGAHRLVCHGSRRRLWSWTFELYWNCEDYGGLSLRANVLCVVRWIWAFWELRVNVVVWKKKSIFSGYSNLGWHLLEIYHTVLVIPQHCLQSLIFFLIEIVYWWRFPMSFYLISWAFYYPRFTFFFFFGLSMFAEFLIQVLNWLSYFIPLFIWI